MASYTECLCCSVSRSKLPTLLPVRLDRFDVIISYIFSAYIFFALINILMSATTDWLYINSEDRLDAKSTTSSDFKLEFKSSLGGRYLLSYLQIPVSVYNVNTNNHQIPFEESGTPKFAQLTPGNYTATTLATEIGTRMTATSGVSNFTVTYDTKTSKFTIVSTNNFRLIYNLFPGSSSRKLLGFNEATTSNATSHTSDNVIDLAYPRAIFINVRENVDSTFTSPTGFNSTFYIPVSYAFGSPQILDAQTFPQTLELSDRTKYLTITLPDKNGATLDLNGVDWEMMLRRTGKYIESVHIPPEKIVKDEGIPGRKYDERYIIKKK